MPVNLLSINTSVGCERDAGERTRPCCEIKSTSSLLFRLPLVDVSFAEEGRAVLDVLNPFNSFELLCYTVCCY